MSTSSAQGSDERIDGTSVTRGSVPDQVRERLIQLITSLSPGERIPAERQLSTDLGVSRETLRRRIDDLEAQGHLERRHGSGTFVMERKLTDQLWMSSFTEDMRARGLEPSSRLLALTRTTAGAAIGARLGLSPDESITVIRRVRLADGEPMALEDVNISTSLTPGLSESDVTTGSLYAILETRYGIFPSSGIQTIEATVVDEEQAKLLEVPVHSPALFVERTTTDADGAVIEFVGSLYRSDRYRFEVECERMPKPLTGRTAT